MNEQEDDHLKRNPRLVELHGRLANGACKPEAKDPPRQFDSYVLGHGDACRCLSCR